MAKRRTDWGSLVAGLLFLALAVAFVVRGQGDWEFNVVWVLPVLAAGLAVAGVARALTRRSRRKDARADGRGETKG
ncbi:hypothetical protein Q8791_01850 [Nocardiopsis sp. CT-R113]|uniref:DUF5668 domain-containing protein n=1 Tax=Nocardiopsis codii TaxID=3065942 RepID=A0ABU7K1B6_9ACTN|nr:hypothetical protein [Nocardiopsis sp. CT-R113]MEE2035964.1 hypothetical protein [Nocardiopsis sp. CT-R113]